MKITGKLKEDILTGKAILFLGAGVSQVAGLLGSDKLANFLFKEAGNLEEYKINKDDLSKLVARFDKDPNFTRRWTDNILKEYLLVDLPNTSISRSTKDSSITWLM